MLHWLFRKKAEDDRLKALLADLTERIERLERGQKGIRLEWEDAFTRLEKMIGRLTGALKRASKAEEPEDEKDAPNGHPEPKPTFVGVGGTHEQLQALRARRAIGAVLPR